MTAQVATRRPGRPKALTREQVADAALELLQTGGFDAVSMRGLGEALGVRPATLYAYFAGKDDVVVALLERAFAPLLEVEAEGDWRAQLAAGIRSYFHVLCDNPSLINPALAAHGRTPGVEPVVERWIELLEVGGFTGSAAGAKLMALAALAFGLASNLAWYEPGVAQQTARHLSPRGAAAVSAIDRALVERAFEDSLAQLLA